MSSGGQVILVGSDFLGRGDQRLGSALVVQFFRALGKREEPPGTIIFMNSGVRLLTEGSVALTLLQELEARGVSIIACRTSVQHFDLEDKIEVGDSAPMADLIETLLSGTVVSL